jgi:hypothetical protein
MNRSIKLKEQKLRNLDKSDSHAGSKQNSDSSNDLSFSYEKMRSSQQAAVNSEDQFKMN